MVSGNQNQKRADDVKKHRPSPENGVKNMKPSRDNWWFFGWGMAIGAVLMGSILTLMNHFKG